MKKLLIFGGAGYIGSHTLKELQHAGYDCVVADNLVYGHRDAVPEDVILVQVDLMDKEGLSELFSTYSFDGVIHFAAYTYVGESVDNPAKYYRNNVVGTLNLLDTMIEHQVKTIVFSSTCAVYGNPEYVPMDEKHPKNPISPYGKSKWMIEEILEDYQRAYGLQYIALRYFNAAGCDRDGELGERHDPETHLIPLVLQTAAGVRRVINIFGDDYETPDGTCIRDYIHVEDLAVAHRLAMEKLWETGESMALNLGTGVGYSVHEVIQAAERVVGKEISVYKEKRRLGDPAILLAHNQKAQKVLQWCPKCTSIDEMIESAWMWMKNRKEEN